MMKFIRANGTSPFGRNTARTIPTPLQLNQPDGVGDIHGNNLGAMQGTRSHSIISTRMSETASTFPFYHGYLSEDQEEEVFREHLCKTGSYIMRDSKSNSSAITMSVVIDPLHLYHFQVVLRERHYRVVGKGKEFPTLDAMISYYKVNNIPGKMDEPVCLTFPIINIRFGRLMPSPTPPDRRHENGRMTPRVKTFRPPTTPTSPSHDSSVATPTQPMQRQSSLPRIDKPPPLLPHYQNAEAETEEALQGDPSLNSEVTSYLGGGACADDITSRPPMPIPIPKDRSDAGGRTHIYSVPDQPDLDRIKMVMELCKQSDMMQASRKKCTCGLYLEESTLAQGWMMHIDNEPGKTFGRIFFLDTKTNTTAWSLPDDITTELKTSFPVKWEFVRKQTDAVKRKNAGT